MVENVISLCIESLEAAGKWFMQVYSAVDGVEVYLGIMCVILSIRYLIFPLTGKSFGSDRARPSGSREDPKHTSSGSTDIMVI